MVLIVTEKVADSDGEAGVVIERARSARSNLHHGGRPVRDDDRWRLLRGLRPLAMTVGARFVIARPRSGRSNLYNGGRLALDHNRERLLRGLRLLAMTDEPLQ